MLVLTRRPGEEIIIDGHIRLTVVSVRGDRIRIGIEAPPSVVVDRQEIHERRQRHPEEVPYPYHARGTEASRPDAVVYSPLNGLSLPSACE